MSAVNRLIDAFIKVAQMPVVEPNPEVSPMPRPPRNNPLGKIPIRRPAKTRVAWQRDKASNPEFNRNVLSKRRGRSSSLTHGIESPEPMSEENVDTASAY